MLKTHFKDGNLHIISPDYFTLADTLDCGQAFRWNEENGIWSGFAGNKFLKLCQNGNDVILYNTTPDEFESFWRKYFDLDRDYGSIIEKIENPKLKDAAKKCSGIRILRQEPWEALCSFIISQNNNIPRIKGIITRLCENFGEKAEYGYSFPSADILAQLTPEDLMPLRCGFRAKYIIDAAKKISSKEIDLEKLMRIPTNDARAELMKIYGVGEKVADCTLLFGLGHLSAFPKDVWIKRALTEQFGGELAEIESPYAGVYQQYIFHSARTI